MQEYYDIHTHRHAPKSCSGKYENIISRISADRDSIVEISVMMLRIDNKMKKKKVAE
jgi:hypothetical protein